MAFKTVWKIKLEAGAVNKISVPQGAEILTVQVQDGLPCIWMLVDPNPEVEIEKREIYTFGTGHAIPHEFKKLNYIGTYQLHGGALIFHVFEGFERVRRCPTS